MDENWRGKTDPVERRRIQNRLNQRAFRQRQRSSPAAPKKKYRPRKKKSGPGKKTAAKLQSSPRKEKSEPPSNEEFEPTTRENKDEASKLNPCSGKNQNEAGGEADLLPAPHQVWDELAALINRNLLAAVATNAKLLGIDLTALIHGSPVVTPRVASGSVPPALQPAELQHRLPHDPIIDTIPHCQFRCNVLQALAAGELDSSAFSHSIRSSGCITKLGDQVVRDGFVVWSSPEHVASWELSEHFFEKWTSLLTQGCEDLLAAANGWRSRRGEKLFPTSFPEVKDLLPGWHRIS